jgi:hypothetical protein
MALPTRPHEQTGIAVGRGGGWHGEPGHPGIERAGARSGKEREHETASQQASLLLVAIVLSSVIGPDRGAPPAKRRVAYLGSEVEVTRHDPSRDIASVSIDADGVREPSELVDALQALGGVVEVRSRRPSAD